MFVPLLRNENEKKVKAAIKEVTVFLKGEVQHCHRYFEPGTTDLVFDRPIAICLVENNITGPWPMATSYFIGGKTNELHERKCSIEGYKN